jgi:hypothetical protein
MSTTLRRTDAKAFFGEAPGSGPYLRALSAALADVQHLCDVANFEFL